MNFIELSLKILLSYQLGSPRGLNTECEPIMGIENLDSLKLSKRPRYYLRSSIIVNENNLYQRNRGRVLELIDPGRRLYRGY